MAYTMKGKQPRIVIPLISRPEAVKPSMFKIQLPDGKDIVALDAVERARNAHIYVANEKDIVFDVGNATEVKPGGGLTIIVGSKGSGKTTLIKQLFPAMPVIHYFEPEMSYDVNLKAVDLHSLLYGITMCANAFGVAIVDSFSDALRHLPGDSMPGAYRSGIVKPLTSLSTAAFALGKNVILVVNPHSQEVATAPFADMLAGIATSVIDLNNATFQSRAEENELPPFIEQLNLTSPYTRRNVTSFKWEKSAVVANVPTAHDISKQFVQRKY